MFAKKSGGALASLAPHPLIYTFAQYNLVFEKNRAGVRGSVFYGALLYKCNFKSDNYTSVLQLFSGAIPRM